MVTVVTVVTAEDTVMEAATDINTVEDSVTSEEAIITEAADSTFPNSGASAISAVLSDASILWGNNKQLINWLIFKKSLQFNIPIYPLWYLITHSNLIFICDKLIIGEINSSENKIKNSWQSDAS